MQDFEYVAPTTLAEAIRLMNGNGLRTKALAGGTDVLVQMRGRRFAIDRLVDVKNIPELNELSCTESDGLTVGAAVPCCNIYEDVIIQRLYPGLVDAASLIGGIQIQSRATIGGNLCNSAPSGDTIPALMVQDATCEIAGPNGRRTVPVVLFCTGPGQNVLQRGEILVALRLAAPKANYGSHFLRFIPRNEMDIAVVNVGASVLLDHAKRRIVSAKIALGSVAPTPVLARKAMDFLAGKEATEATIEEAAEAAKSAARPIDDMRGTIKHRVHLVGVLTKRALQGAILRARGEE
ncbi:MAG: xanthine dehydrogenase family protein subunit M [Dehalococcoidia bacterium]|nr:xanthine dehydrogenase family protein subunit M [Dehalococcoidia bacterium]